MILSDSCAQEARKLVLRKVKSTWWRKGIKVRGGKEGIERERVEKGELWPSLESERRSSCWRVTLVKC